MSKPLLRIDIDNGKYTLVQHEDGGTEILRYGQRWMGSPSGFAGVNAVLAMGYELEELREFKEKTEAEIARKLFEVEITLGNCPTPEPSIRKMEGSGVRSEEHTSELQSLMRISFAVFFLKK